MSDDFSYEYLRRTGINSASADLLLAMCLSPNEDLVGLREESARQLHRKYELSRIHDITVDELVEIGELAPFDASRIVCAIALGRRAGMSSKPKSDCINRPEDAFDYLRYLQSETREHFVAMFLNSKNGVISTKTIHIGTINASIVGARELFREAVREAAVTIILAHNHPSGDPTPSIQDIDITHKLMDAAELLDIPIVDHIVIGSGKFASMKRLKII